MTSVLALVLLGAKVSIASPGVSCVRIEQPVCEAYSDRFATQLGASGAVKVVTARDISQVLGLERQKQLLGCSDASSSCMSELAGALGVDGVLTFSVTQSDGAYIVTLRIVKSNDGSTWATASERVSSESALFDALDGAADRFERVLTGRPVDAARSTGAKVAPLVLGGAGLALAGAGVAVYFGVVKSNETSLRSGVIPLERVEATISNGRSGETAAWAMIGVGAAAVAAAAVWVAVRPGAPTVAVIASPEGAALAIGGAF